MTIENENAFPGLLSPNEMALAKRIILLEAKAEASAENMLRLTSLVDRLTGLVTGLSNSLRGTQDSQQSLIDAVRDLTAIVSAASAIVTFPSESEQPKA